MARRDVKFEERAFTKLRYLEGSSRFWDTQGVSEAIKMPDRLGMLLMSSLKALRYMRERHMYAS